MPQLTSRIALALVLLAACKGNKSKPADEKAPATTPAPALVEPKTAEPEAAQPATPPATTPPAGPAGAPATDEEAAALVYAAAQDPAKADAAAALVPAGHKVKLAEKGGGSGKKSFEGVAGLQETFGAGNATSMKLGACKKGCCDFKAEFDDDRSLGMQLRKVCFDDKRALTSVEIAYEN